MNDKQQVTPGRKERECEALLVATVPAPVVPLDEAFACLRDERYSLLWDPPRGLGIAAMGVATSVRGSGARRVSEVLEATRLAWARTKSRELDGAPAPRFWGGLAFAPGTADVPEWKPFGDALFCLPRIAYLRDGERAWVQVAGDHARDALADDAKRFCARLSRSTPREASLWPRPRYSSAEPDIATWRKQVADILAAIAAGEVSKVVAARCTRIVLGETPALDTVLRALKDESSNAWRFAMTVHGSTFLAATPEILVSRRGTIVESEAMAGTLDKSAGGPYGLLASGKDREEHQFVVEAILEAFAPLCAQVEAPPEPEARELPQLYHLATAVRGELERPFHVLEVCEKLHPTPATGGTPRNAALARILASEPVPRGWYAGPFGWFDASGDGEFVVALRSGLLSRNSAYVYAGAGIVAGSNADDELAETQLKQRTLLRALGVTIA
jgi:menaquinone-specific isochorismate synthase